MKPKGTAGYDPQTKAKTVLLGNWEIVQQVRCFVCMQWTESPNLLVVLWTIPGIISWHRVRSNIQAQFGVTQFHSPKKYIVKVLVFSLFYGFLLFDECIDVIFFYLFCFHLSPQWVTTGKENCIQELLNQPHLLDFVKL